MIGLTLDLPSDQREEGTMVTTVWAVQKGCMFVRVLLSYQDHLSVQLLLYQEIKQLTQQIFALDAAPLHIHHDGQILQAP